MDVAELASTILEASEPARDKASGRFLIGIAGPPASGKSTLAEGLCALIGPDVSSVVPMDGFHFDDRVLAERGLSHRKGAPETFDFRGFEVLLRRIRSEENEIAFPVFDRSMELSRAGAGLIPLSARIVFVEGNYLLLDEAPWLQLASLFDLTIFLDAPRDELDRRLVERWRMHGRDPQAARHWIDSTDRPNIERVLDRRREADLVIQDVSGL